MMVSLEIRRRTYRALHTSARVVGHYGMGSELADHRESAAASYGLAYWLARWRDRI
jgi:hypothetical protein